MELWKPPARTAPWTGEEARDWGGAGRGRQCSAVQYSVLRVWCLAWAQPCSLWFVARALLLCCSAAWLLGCLAAWSVPRQKTVDFPTMVSFRARGQIELERQIGA